MCEAQHRVALLGRDVAALKVVGSLGHAQVAKLDGVGDLLPALVEGWSTVDEEYTLRAARIFGDAARRAAEGWVALFASIGSGADKVTPGLAREIDKELLHLEQHWPADMPQGVIHADL